MKKDNIDKLTDKAFMRLIITSVLAIGVCMVCLCSTTWAWFTESQTSSSNTITSSQCQLAVKVYKDNENTAVIERNFADGAINESLKAGDRYTVTLKIPEGSASGYCIIKIVDEDSNDDNDIKVYSQAVTNNTDPVIREISFTVVAKEDVKVSIIPRWGIYSGNDYIEAGGSVNLTANGATIAAPTSQTDSVTVEETETEETKAENEVTEVTETTDMP